MKRFLPYILIILILFFGPILINILMSIKTPYVHGSVVDWIGFFGSYSGGIIGGIVAYVIARFQLSENKRFINRGKFRLQYPHLMSIRLEIEKTMDNLSYLQDIANDKDVEKTTFTYKFTGLSTNFWSDVLNLTDVQLQTKLIDFYDFYGKLSDALSIDIKIITRELELRDLEMLKNVGNTEVKDETNTFIKKEVRKRQTEIESISKQKKELINKFIKNTYLDKAQDLLTCIDQISQSIIDDIYKKSGRQ